MELVNLFRLSVTVLQLASDAVEGSLVSTKIVQEARLHVLQVIKLLQQINNLD